MDCKPLEKDKKTRLSINIDITVIANPGWQLTSCVFSSLASGLRGRLSVIQVRPEHLPS